MDAPRGRGPQWSPRLARKKMEATPKNQKDERRRTLAELAVEAGYQVRQQNLQVDSKGSGFARLETQNVMAACRICSVNTAEIRFSTERSPQFWVRG